jgi:hypothetical protein
MPNKMPEDIEKLLYELDSHEDIERIQKQWNDLSRQNELYEHTYLQQLGNTVEGNLKFKEAKTLINPAEQMHQFNESIRQELQELNGKGVEQEYYLDIEKPDNDNSKRADAMKDFQLTWSDASMIEQTTDDKQVQSDIDQNFELEWHHPPEADNDNYPQDTSLKDVAEQGASDRTQKIDDFKLTFDTIGQDDHQFDRDIETERDDKDFEYDDD